MRSNNTLSDQPLIDLDPAGNTSNIADESTPLARRVFLLQEHRDLDDMISLLAEANSVDEALITRLKKRKLHIKDEIARLDAVATLAA